MGSTYCQLLWCNPYSAGLSAEDLGFESPFCWYQHPNYPGGETGGLRLDPVVGVCSHGAFHGPAGCIAVCSSFIGHVFSIGGAVSPLRRKHT